ncbi:MAG: peptide chain release factor N(5)-glutamine methyltransferase [Gemmataceae bacterium]|nr:peptide chain release factor N(5)-glutamine methyltransferase [Gemmataceae bacterium]
MSTTSRTATAEQNWTVGQLLEWTKRFLGEKGCESPQPDAEVLLAHALGCKRIDLYGRLYGEQATEGVRQRYRELVRKRVEGCPVAYLVGRKEFYKLELEVSAAVLIPRPDSETVVVECLALARGMPGPRVLDIGTGSGNLAVAIAKYHKGAQLTAVDISPEALAVARRNADKHGVTERVRFLQGDLFEAVPAGERFDFVVSNPPYIPRGEIASLERGVRDYEPHLALDGGPDGYSVFERLVEGARACLEPGGHLIVEIGAPQELPARQRITALGGYDLAPTVYDAARHPRVLKARWLGPGPGQQGEVQL